MKATDRIRRRMDELVASGLTPEQASRRIAEEQTRAYFDGLRERKKRRRRHR